MTQERRKRSRVPVHFEVHVLVAKTEIKVQTVNISLTGLLCLTDPLFQNNAACKIGIKLSDEIQIYLEGKFLRVGKDETAISFTSMDEESFHHLKRIVAFNAVDADVIDREITVAAFK
jgi:hypothetical protein